MKFNRRIDDLYAKLTARERAKLLLEEWKKDPSAPLGRGATVPIGQVNELQRYMSRLINLNGNVGILVTSIEGRLDGVFDKMCWLSTIRHFGEVVYVLRDYIWSFSKEPITESDYSRRLEAADATTVSPQALAERLVHREVGEPISDRKRNRLVETRRLEILSLVEKGTLTGVGSDLEMEVLEGSVRNWLGEKAEVRPDWGLQFDVQPDALSDQVQLHREVRRQVNEASKQAPIAETLDKVLGVTFMKDLLARVSSRDGAYYDETASNLKKTIEDVVAICWRELGALKAISDDVGKEFGGEDPLLPEIRDRIQSFERRITGWKDLAPADGISLTLVPPSADEIAAIRLRLHVSRKVATRDSPIS